MHQFTRRLATSRRAALVLTVAAMAAVAAGCGDDGGGGSDSSTDTSASLSGGTAGLEAAKTAYTEFKKPPSDLGDIQPIGKEIPTGKKLVYIYCGVPVCDVLADGAKNAADVLEWEYETISSDGTPESVKKAWATAVRMKPDAVLSSGFDTAVYKAELEELKKMNIPVVNYATTDEGPTGNVTARIGDPKAVGAQGELLAAEVAAESDGKATTLFVDVPAFTILKSVGERFDAHYAEWCEGCKVEHLELPITALGKDATQRVVSYLRAHPDTNWVVFSVDAASVGLPAALKAAGLTDKVKFAGASGTVENLGYIEQGLEAGTANQGYYEEVAVMVDLAARAMLGESVDYAQTYKLPYFLETTDSILTSKGFEPRVPDLYAKWAEIWGKS